MPGGVRQRVSSSPAPVESDCDGDGTPDICELAPYGPDEDCDGDGVPYDCELDGDGRIVECAAHTSVGRPNTDRSGRDMPAGSGKGQLALRNDFGEASATSSLAGPGGIQSVIWDGSRGVAWHVDRACGSGEFVVR